jgi:4-amino-4-deoxy-L-arabinose transferase-like glycosyltransferase
MLYGKPFMTKPPLHLWLIGISQVIAGHGNVFVWRLPSAIAGALLCAIACLFAVRWFGRTAGLISGISCAGMITLWGQSQVADIDATNTLAAALCAMCGIELLVGSPRNPWPWMFGAALSLGATLMTKGPGGLPIILGVWLWGTVVVLLRREFVPLLRDILLPVMIGGGIFAAYAIYAKHSLAQHHLQPDLSGVQEGASRLYATSLKTLGMTLVTIPTQILAFGVPVTMALPLYWLKQVRSEVPITSRPIAAAIISSVFIALTISVLSGMDNPRYGYPILIPLCPLAGAVCVVMSRTVEGKKWLVGIGGFCAVAYVLVAAGLSFSAWRLSHRPGLLPILIGSTIIAMFVVGWMLPRLGRSWNAAWGFVPLIWLVAIPFGIQRYVDRSNTSGIHAAADLRRIIGPAEVVEAGNAVISKPEVFYYANVGVDYYPDRREFMPASVRRGHWVILDTLERKRWQHLANIRMENEQWLCRNGPTDYYVVWYP